MDSESVSHSLSDSLPTSASTSASLSESHKVDSASTSQSQTASASENKYDSESIGSSTATEPSSSGDRVSTTSVVADPRATHSTKAKTKLPQTGNETTTNVGLLGGLGLFLAGLLGRKKRRDQSDK